LRWHTGALGRASKPCATIQSVTCVAGNAANHTNVAPRIHAKVAHPGQYIPGASRALDLDFLSGIFTRHFTNKQNLITPVAIEFYLHLLNVTQQLSEALLPQALRAFGRDITPPHLCARIFDLNVSLGRFRRGRGRSVAVAVGRGRSLVAGSLGGRVRVVAGRWSLVAGRGGRWSLVAGWSLVVAALPSNVSSSLAPQALHPRTLEPFVPWRTLGITALMTRHNASCKKQIKDKL
jgi:hypothetical protein